MSVTVATVVLNAADALGATLESALMQDHDDVEVIVVDGGSTDRTHAVLARYEGVVDRIEVAEDGGVFYAMNRAAALATKDTILFMNAGDRFHTARALSKLWARRRPSADIVYGHHIRADGVETLKAARDMDEHVAALRAGVVSWEWFEGAPVHQATLTRTSLLREMRYDTSFRMAADHDLLMRAYANGADIQYVDEIVCVYRSGGLSDRRRALTALELNAVYRAVSERPDAIDAFFFPEGSPFAGLRSPYAGDVLSGLLPEDDALRGTLPIAGRFRWAGGRGLRLLSPVHRSAEALKIAGYNEAPRQVVEVFVGGERVAREALAEGSFELRVPFDPPLAPATAIDVATQAAMRLPGRVEIVSLAVTDLSFRLEGPLHALALETRFEVNAAGGRQVAAALVEGWWGLERTHVWSHDLAELRLASEDRVRSIAITAFANPALEAQSVTVALNGVELGTIALERHETTTHLGVGEAWRRAGAENRLRFSTSAVGRVGADPRELGFGLASLTLS